MSKAKKKGKTIVFTMKNGSVADFETLTGLSNPKGNDIDYLELAAKEAMLVDQDIESYRIEEGE